MAPHLRILAGPSLNSSSFYLEDITNLVNTTRSFPIHSDLFEGEVVVNIKGFVGNEGQQDGCRYFEREDRKDITWSVQVRGRFLKPILADDVLFGNTFDRPLWLPWGSSAVFKFMKYIDPTLEHDLGSQTKPWALSPLISTMPHFEHTRLRSKYPGNTSSVDSNVENEDEKVTKYRDLELPSFPPLNSIGDDTSQLHFAGIRKPSSSGEETDTSSGSSNKSSSKTSIKNGIKNKIKRSKKKGGNSIQPFTFLDASERRSYFSDSAHRQALRFGPNDIISTDFCYGFLEFSPSLALRLPGGLSFDLMKYWDGQPVRFVCCERKNTDVEGEQGNSEPWGRIFWSVIIELQDVDVSVQGSSS